MKGLFVAGAVGLAFGATLARKPQPVGERVVGRVGEGADAAAPPPWLAAASAQPTP